MCDRKLFLHCLCCVHRDLLWLLVFAHGRVNDPMAKLQFLRVGWGGVGWGGDDDIL